MEAETILSVEHVGKSFGSHRVLTDVSLSVARGDVTCIIGASGSGKSTLLRCINLLERPSEGHIYYHGEDILRRGMDAAAYRARVGMVFQSFNLFNNMNVLDNCMDGPYAEAAGISDLAGATCTSQQATVWYDTCLPQIEDADILPAMESAPAMLVALESGRCDLVVTDMPTAMAACVAYPDMKLLDFTGTDDDFAVSEEEINIGISVQKGNETLLNALNEALATLTTDDFTAMMNEAISVQPLSEG